MRQGCEGRYRKPQGTVLASPGLVVGRPPWGDFRMEPILAALVLMGAAGLLCLFFDAVSSDEGD